MDPLSVCTLILDPIILKKLPKRRFQDKKQQQQQWIAEFWRSERFIQATNYQLPSITPSNTSAAGAIM